MLLLYPGELYRLLGASSYLYHTHGRHYLFTCTTHLAAIIFLLVLHTWPPLSFYLYHTHGRHYLFTCTTHMAAIIFLLVPHTWPPLSFYLYHPHGRHYLFSSPGPKVHVNYCHHLASVVCRLSSVVCRPSSVVCRLSSVNFSHFKLLLRNHLADWNRT